jgi:uncharacterized protein YcfJ
MQPVENTMKNRDRNKLDRDDSSGAEQTGEAVGGIGGTLAGAALGSLAGPVGTIIGGVAGAVGGWWAGDAVAEAAQDSDRHESEYRHDFEKRPVDREIDYDAARVGYDVGYIASRNPDYSRHFGNAENDLRRGWHHDRFDYDRLRPFVERGYEYGLRNRTGRAD